jgi:hypothetical protein
MCCPNDLKNIKVLLSYTGKPYSNVFTQSVYTCIKVLGWFGVKGLRILLLTGNKLETFEFCFWVFAPNPNKGKLTTFSYDLAIMFIMSL